MLKKMGAFVLVLALVCCFALAAGEETEETIELDRLTTTGNTTVTMTVNNNRDTYIVVIPSKVEIDPVTQYGEGTITLKSGWTLISVNGLDVKLTAAANGIADYYENSFDVSKFQNFKMISDEGNAVYYAIVPSNLGKPLSLYNHYYSSTTIFSYQYNTNLISINKGGDNSEDQSCTLKFSLKTMPPAGIYYDTLTFSIITR